MYYKKYIPMILLSFFLLTGCAGLQRGMEGEHLVSSARPAVDISVAGLPMRTSGLAVPSVTTGESLSGVPVDTWLAVYGGTTLEQPMAIIAISEAPVSYYWDSDLSHNFSTDQGIVSYNDQSFYACTYIIEGRRDAFAALLPVAEPAAQKFLARRFAQRSNFNESKITFEYREPLPTDITQLVDLALYSREYISAFEQRAYNTFVVTSYTPSKAAVTHGFLENVQVRFLNTNFLGTLSRLDPIADN